MMKRTCTSFARHFLVAACLTAALPGSGAGRQARPAARSDAGRRTVWHFEDVPAGRIPPGWKVEATRPRGPLATWKVIEDDTAPSGNHVLAMTSPNHRSGGTFNICWTNSVSFLNGAVEVKFKAVRGRIDEGGGVIWRVQDRNNYYVARFNPLEDNFRLYYVRKGVRRMLADCRISLPPGTWHTLRIVQNGDRIEGYIDGMKRIESTSRVFTGPGGVGLWTKADAVTSFDDFTVEVK